MHCVENNGTARRRVTRSKTLALPAWQPIRKARTYTQAQKRETGYY